MNHSQSVLTNVLYPSVELTRDTLDGGVHHVATYPGLCSLRVQVGDHRDVCGVYAELSDVVVGTGALVGQLVAGSAIRSEYAQLMECGRFSDSSNDLIMNIITGAMFIVLPGPGYLRPNHFDTSSSRVTISN